MTDHDEEWSRLNSEIVSLRNDIDRKDDKIGRLYITIDHLVKALKFAMDEILDA